MTTRPIDDDSEARVYFLRNEPKRSSLLWGRDDYEIFFSLIGMFV